MHTHLLVFQLSLHQKDDLNVSGIFQCAAAVPGFQMAPEILKPGLAVSQHVQTTCASTALMGAQIGDWEIEGVVVVSSGSLLHSHTGAQIVAPSFDERARHTSFGQFPSNVGSLLEDR